VSAVGDRQRSASVLSSLVNSTLAVSRLRVPVSVCAARGRDELPFRTLHAGCGSPLQSKRWCPVHDAEVGADEFVRGVEVAPGAFVEIEPDELEGALPTSQLIELDRFVAWPADPLLVDKVFYLAPAAELPARRAYALLLSAFEATGVAGIARIVLFGREQRVAVHVADRVLCLATLFAGSDVRSAEPIRRALRGVAIEAPEAGLACELLERLTAPRLNLRRFAPRDRKRLVRLVEEKLAAGAVVEAPSGRTTTMDLATALEESLKARNGH
jgi:DNA end-binding protein Ku